MTHKTLRLTSAIPLVLLAAIACKKQDEPAATAGYQAGTPGAAGAPAAVPVTPAPSASTPVVTAPAPAPSASAPVPVDPALAAAITPLLTQLGASQTVAGSKPLGTAMVGNVGGAQVLEQIRVSAKTASLRDASSAFGKPIGRYLKSRFCTR